MANVRQLSMKMDDDVHKQLKLYCVMNDLSIADVATKAISDYIHRNGVDKIELVKAS